MELATNCFESNLVLDVNSYLSSGHIHTHTRARARTRTHTHTHTHTHTSCVLLNYSTRLDVYFWRRSRQNFRVTMYETQHLSSCWASCWRATQGLSPAQEYSPFCVHSYILGLDTVLVLCDIPSGAASVTSLGGDIY